MQLSKHNITPVPVVDYTLAAVQSPLLLATWKSKLKSHPDQDFAQYVTHGIEFGFRIGAKGVLQACSTPRNMPSATRHGDIVDAYLQDELAKGNMLGPFPPTSAPNIHINRIGVIPKKHQAGKWRIITDLSFPEENSVNDMIGPSLCSLSYITVQQVAQQAMLLGRGALLAKIDIKAAYRLVPVSPADRQWVSIKWNDQVYVDAMLPFGLRSTPKIFTAVADALEWCVAVQGVENVSHYLDDFTVMGPQTQRFVLEIY